MTAVRDMRASDQDRQKTVDVLCDAHVVGRLRPGEFYERLDSAHAARTWGELDDLTADLPFAWAEADLPAGFAGRDDRPRGPGPHLVQHVLLLCALILGLGLIVQVPAVALWTGALVALFVLLLPFVTQWGGARLWCIRRTRSARGRDSRQHQLPGA
jgi:hypothetical protein